MTRRRELERHRQSLGEIREIMNSMKTLAYMETRKLDRFLDAQHAVVQNIEEVVADLLSFYPETLPDAEVTTPVYIVIGTERGFCGDFNHALLEHLESTLQESPAENPTMILVGRKLYTLLEDDERVAAWFDGASVAEEVTSLLNNIVSELTALQEKHGVLTLFCLYHGDQDGIVMQKLLPPFQDLRHKPPRFACPPVMNLAPRELLVEFVDSYLFASLHEMLYTSLMVENHQRVTHLDGAVKHLDDQSAEMARQANTLRQEEIVEEIEVILLSAASLDERPDK
jgi:F-type H+-transporting ATPase subunit gamma